MGVDVGRASLRRFGGPGLCALVILAHASCSSPAVAPVDGGSPDDATVDSGELGDAEAANDGGEIPADANSPCPDSGDCDGNPPDPDEPDLQELCGSVPTTLEEWEDCYAARTCEWTVHCDVQNGFADVAECVDLADAVAGGRLSAERRERRRAVEHELASVDPEAFSRCLEVRSADRCNTALHHPSCATRFVGTVEDGGTCYGDVECASPGATCARDCPDACCEGVCEPLDKEGESCGRRSCEPGLQCGDGTCVQGQIGMSCRVDAYCERGAWCDQDCETCTAALPEGAECRSDRQCAGKTTCVRTSGSLEPGRCRRISEPGDTCDGFCWGNLYCGGSSCQPMPELGQPCGFVGCLGKSLECRDGLCTERVGEGQPCSNAGCLPGLFCTSELDADVPVCASPGEPGARCTGPHQCESYLCSGDATEPGECLRWVESCNIASLRDSAASPSTHDVPPEPKCQLVRPPNHETNARSRAFSC